MKIYELVDVDVLSTILSLEKEDSKGNISPLTYSDIKHITKVSNIENDLNILCKRLSMFNTMEHVFILPELSYIKDFVRNILKNNDLKTSKKHIFNHKQFIVKEDVKDININKIKIIFSRESILDTSRRVKILRIILIRGNKDFRDIYYYPSYGMSNNQELFTAVTSVKDFYKSLVNIYDNEIDAYFQDEIIRVKTEFKETFDIPLEELENEIEEEQKPINKETIDQVTDSIKKRSDSLLNDIESIQTEPKGMNYG